jgi:hypothetical protein
MLNTYGTLEEGEKQLLLDMTKRKYKDSGFYYLSKNDRIYGSFVNKGYIISIRPHRTFSSVQLVQITFKGLWIAWLVRKNKI